MPSKIALRYLDGKDKISLLNDVLDISGLEDAIEVQRAASGMERADFKIVIKPNASMFVRRDDVGTTTDSMLVLALVERLHEKGYSNISVVESGNAYAVTFHNHNPMTIMTAMGLNGGVHAVTPEQPRLTAHVADSEGALHPYQLIDLGADTTEVAVDAMPHGKLKIGSAWLNADFRISFAKFKTHIYGGYTLLVKNTYGCLPETDKMLHYHKKTGCAKPAIEQLKLCPVHFGIVDGITGADGWIGVKWDRAIPRRPGFILAGQNIAKTEQVACRIMGVDINESPMTKGALEFLDEDGDLDGEIRPLEKWSNVPKLIYSGFPLTEKSYYFYKFQQSISDGLGSPPLRRKPIGLIATYLLILPALLYAFHRRHWIIRKLKDLKLRWAIRSEAKAPKRIRCELDRLDAPELALLSECLKSNSTEPPRIFGHRVVAAGKWHALPDSTYFKLVRIPEILETLTTDSEVSGCIQEVEARLHVLKAQAA